jgi:hypothetical protein
MIDSKRSAMLLTVLLTGVLLMTGTARAEAQRETDRIKPWPEDPRYWQYRGRPLLLIGASNEDNLFNHPIVPPTGEALPDHLDRMLAAGGNYVRNTMSSRDEGNVWPFARDEQTGLYDLREPGAEYWQRFERFLQMTRQRGIIVQIEIWDRFDYARAPWQDNPFNPKNNSNYTSEQSRLPERIDTHPGQRENPFFRSIPELEGNKLILPFQEAHVRRMMEISLPFDNVLYCISNETNDSEQWSRYWARFIRGVADEHGRAIEVTEMWDAWDLRDPTHRRTFDHPDLYSFVDVSQNTQQIGQTQWDNLQWLRQRVANPPRPVNNVKMYGGHHGGGPEEGQHKLWRNILGGTASARYHRPGGGIGLNEVTESHLRSLTKVLERVNIFTLEPANELLSDREPDEAYLAAVAGEQYAVYFPRGGSVTLELPADSGPYRLQWLDVRTSAWGDSEEIRGPKATLKAPGDGPAAAVILRP